MHKRGPATLKDLLILRIAKWYQFPSIIHYHMGRLPDIIARNGVEWKSTRQAMRLADVVIPLDKNSEKCVQAALPEVNIVKLPNFVEIDEIERIRKGSRARRLPRGDPLGWYLRATLCLRRDCGSWLRPACSFPIAV